MAMPGPEEFVAPVVQAFPELGPVLARSAGALHRQVGDFAAFAQDAKDQGNWPTYEKCVQLADHLLAAGSPVVAGAIRTEFVSHLEFEGSRGPAAWQLLPAALQSAWKQVDAENRRLMALPQKEGRQAAMGRRVERRPRPRGPEAGGPPGRSPKGPGGRKGRRGPRGRGRGRGRDRE